MKIHLEPNADGDGERDGQQAHGDISHGQRHQEIVGGVLQGAVDGHSPADQHVASDGEHGDDELQHDVGGFHSVHGESPAPGAGAAHGRKGLSTGRPPAGTDRKSVV